MTIPEAERKSKYILDNYLFSIFARKDDFTIHSHRREMLKIVNSGKATPDDWYALAILEFNLGNYSESMKTLKGLSTVSPEFRNIYAYAQLTLVQNSISISKSESAILNEFFTGTNLIKPDKLLYQMIKNSIQSNNSRFGLKKDIIIKVEYFNPKNFKLTSGPFEFSENIEPSNELDHGSNIGSVFDLNLQIYILNNGLEEKHRKFLIDYLDENEIDQLITENTAEDLKTERDYSEYTLLNI
ncbi:MAG: hypothetical protein SH817_08700 [Leptospira sp.]|nr:hypothetical protein [Leptospira sp.]